MRPVSSPIPRSVTEYENDPAIGIGTPLPVTLAYSHMLVTLSCRDFACADCLPLIPDVSAFVQGGFVPSAIMTRVRGTLCAPSGVRSFASEYSRTSFPGVRSPASAASPARSVSLRSFETDSLPHPSSESVSTASLNDPCVTARRVATDDAHGVIFRSTPKALNTSDSPGLPTRYGNRTSHQPKRVNTCFARIPFAPGAFDRKETDDMTSPT